jgi:hypothetical protein
LLFLLFLVKGTACTREYVGMVRTGFRSVVIVLSSFSIKYYNGNGEDSKGAAVTGKRGAH